MFLCKAAIVLVTLSVAFADEAVEKAFVDNEIVADLKLAAAPKELVEITYPSGVTVNLGNELTPTEVKDIPFLKWKSEQGKFYTVLMTDPDAPSRADPKFREVRHWLVMNVPNNEVSEGDTIFEFVGTGAPEGTALHRYVTLIFEQEGKIDTSNIAKTRNCSREGRLSSSTETLIKDNKLDKIVAGNFYQAQFDSYVPILQKQLSGCKD